MKDEGKSIQHVNWLIITGIIGVISYLVATGLLVYNIVIKSVNSWKSINEFYPYFIVLTILLFILTICLLGYILFILKNKYQIEYKTLDGRQLEKYQEWRIKMVSMKNTVSNDKLEKKTEEKEEIIKNSFDTIIGILKNELDMRKRNIELETDALLDISVLSKILMPFKRQAKFNKDRNSIFENSTKNIANIFNSYISQMIGQYQDQPFYGTLVKATNNMKLELSNYTERQSKILSNGLKKRLSTTEKTATSEKNAEPLVTFNSKGQGEDEITECEVVN